LTHRHNDPGTNKTDDSEGNLKKEAELIRFFYAGIFHKSQLNDGLKTKAKKYTWLRAQSENLLLPFSLSIEIFPQKILPGKNY
jgi:hypothetical protein